MTMHSVWANRVCSSRSKSSNPPAFDDFVFLQQGADALGEVVEHGPDIAGE